MANIIIGHTDHESTTIWVRGERRERWVRIDLQKLGDGTRVPRVERRLSRKKDFTWSHRFTDLEAEARYSVIARFACTRWGLKSGRVVKGALRTFPRTDNDGSFSFLHGSCNLSTVRMTHTGAHAAARLGLLAAQFSLKRLTGEEDEGRFDRIQKLLRGVVAGFYLRTSTYLFRGIFKATGFDQAKSLLPKAFEALLKLVSPEGPSSHQKEEPPRFMIHAGDQIYYDIPIPKRAPDLDEYRRTYRQTWFEDESLRKLLRECPHYMIWDDHDIVDAFAQDGPMPGGRQPWEYFDPAWDAYKEYVHCRHPGDKDGKTLFYNFQYGKVPFFVLDTRKERYIHKGQMISAGRMKGLSANQMKELKDWLSTHKKDLMFVVSSVPFLGEPRLPTERNDKWCGDPFKEQRKEILEHVFKEEIKRLVFLVGDMHCTYHAVMRLGRFGSRVTLHELAGGPAYQLQFARRKDFCDQIRSEIEVMGEKGLEQVPYTTSLRRVHGAASSVLKITARPSALTCQVEWEVVATGGRIVFPIASPPGASRPPAEEPIRPPTLSGRISF